MHCIEYSPKLLPDLTRLLNGQLAALPPGWNLAAEQVARVIESAPNLWRAHFPEQAAPYNLETVCVIDQGRLAAAAQWGHPTQPHSTQLDDSMVLFWIVADPDSKESLCLLLDALVAKSLAAASPRIITTRYSFGVGWLGIPAAWSHVVEALQTSGFNVNNRWKILTSPVDLLEIRKTEPVESMKTSWQVNENASEWDLQLYSSGSLVGECSAWGIPEHFSGCEEYSNWITIEWLGVEPAYWRKSIGRWLIAEQLRRQAKRGIKHAILWTETDNQPFLSLAESLGFQAGPESWDLEKEFD